VIVSEEADSEGYVYTRRKYGFIDTAGKEVIPLEYDAALPFSGGVACVEKGPDLSWKYGYIDKNNQFVLPMQYNYASSFADGWAMVGTGGYGWQLRQSRFLSDDVSYTRRPQFGGSYRMINRSGQVIDLPGYTIYANARNEPTTSGGLVAVYKNGKVGYLAPAGLSTGE